MISAQLRLGMQPEHRFLLGAALFSTTLVQEMGAALFSTTLVQEGGPSSSSQDSCSWQSWLQPLGFLVLQLGFGM